MSTPLTTAPKLAQLPSKEATLFRHLLQDYEAGRYKKALKAAGQILRKHPTHGNTQALKALVLNTLGKSEEAFELCKLALKNDMKSSICWHAYGLLYRSVRNYEESIKAYRFALRIDPNSVQILKDMAQLQAQMRDYSGLVKTRHTLLQGNPQCRLNWTALAVALHLNGDLEGAENILHMYEETLRRSPPKGDIEHSEAALYRNTIIAEQGNLDKALEHLCSIDRIVVDRLALMELKAEYLLALKKREEAETACRALLERNAENIEYYEALEEALGLDRANPDDHVKLLEMYQSFAEKSDRIDAARRLPLDFLQGDAFKEHAEKYLRRMFAKGVPSTFANLKQLYGDDAKRLALQELAEKLIKESPPEKNGAAKGDEPDAEMHTTWQLSANYYLAQHYDHYHSRDSTKAKEYIAQAIALNPSKTDYTFHMTSARILKHLGAADKASKAMNEAREMDLKDRYINTKCAKYQLRNNEHESAMSTMGLFTRKEAPGGPLGDLTDMQCVSFVTEDGESYLRQGKLSLALKRFKTVSDIFEIWTDDQFDFYHFSLRKGMVRAYVDMVQWEDRLREHPFFTRAALSAIRIYIKLFDDPQLAQQSQTNGDANQTPTEKKKAAKQAKKEAEAEKKAKNGKQPQPKAEDDAAANKGDPDPHGLELVKTEKPLEEAMKYLLPLIGLSPKNIDVQIAGFEVYIRRQKYLPALKCLLATHAINPNHPKCHEHSGRLKLALDKLDEPLPPKAKEVIESCYLSKLSSKSLEECNEEYLESHKDSAPHVQSAVRMRNILHPESEARAKSLRDLQATLNLHTTTLEQAMAGVQLLDETVVGKDPVARQAYVQAAHEKWPEATAFQSSS